MAGASVIWNIKSEYTEEKTWQMNDMNQHENNIRYFEGLGQNDNNFNQETRSFLQQLNTWSSSNRILVLLHLSTSEQPTTILA